MLAKQKISKWLTCFTHVSLWRRQCSEWAPSSQWDRGTRRCSLSSLLFPRNFDLIVFLFFGEHILDFVPQTAMFWIKHSLCQGLPALLSHYGASSRYDLCFLFPCPFHITFFFFLRLFSLHSLYSVLHLLLLQMHFKENMERLCAFNRFLLLCCTSFSLAPDTSLIKGKLLSFWSTRWEVLEHLCVYVLTKFQCLNV